LATGVAGALSKLCPVGITFNLLLQPHSLPWLGFYSPQNLAGRPLVLGDLLPNLKLWNRSEFKNQLTVQHAVVTNKVGGS